MSLSDKIMMRDYSNFPSMEKKKLFWINADDVREAVISLKAQTASLFSELPIGFHSALTKKIDEIFGSKLI